MSEIDLDGNGLNLWMDSREATGKPQILKNLEEFGINVKVENLGNCIDYLITDINGARYAIQRKTVNEMVNPNKTFEDLIGMGMLENSTSYLLLEGSLTSLDKWVKMPHRVIGGIRSVVFDYECKIIPTANSYWTSIMLSQIVKKLGKSKDEEQRPLSVGEALDRDLPLRDQGRRIIETLPNIGKTLAIRIMEKYNSAREALININDWNTIEGIGSGKLETINQVLDAKWVESVNKPDQPINGVSGS